MNKIILIVSFMFFQATPYIIQSVEPDEVLKNSELEERAKVISAKLRCLVCQNESINNSNADIAKDLRMLVRDKLLSGETDKEILEYIHQRYGDFVLYSPPLKSYTLLLWLFPIFFFCFLIYLFFRIKR